MDHQTASILAVLLGLTLALAACKPAEPAANEPVEQAANEPGPAPEPASAEDISTLVAANNQFALDLHARLAAEIDGNVFCSPASVAAALSMTAGGAAGDTLEQMRRTLHASLPPARRHDAWASLMAELVAGSGDGWQLRIANRLWGQRGMSFRTEFLTLTRDDYGAELAVADFVNDTEAGRLEINGWVSEQTADRIPELLPEGVLDRQTRLVLVNAIWFKGSWEEAFDPDRTAESDFRKTATETTSVAMMSLSGKSLRYAKVDAVQVIELPYRGDDLAMLVVLPDVVDGVKAVEAALTTDRLDRWLEAMRPGRVDVFLPRFEVRTKVRLKETLRALGMTSAFVRGAADFSGMDGSRLLFLSAVVHEAWVKVDEEGTEAAAATGAVMTATSMPPTFRADHPFLVLIRDRRTGAILFTGRVADPPAS